MVERAGWDFVSLCVMIFCFLCFYFLLLFFYNDISRLENGNSWRELTKEKAGICTEVSLSLIFFVNINDTSCRIFEGKGRRRRNL